MNPEVTAFHHPASGTLSYVVHAPGSRQCAVIDPVLDFDMASGRTATTTVDRVIDHVEDAGLEVAWILETHAHADHLSAAPYLRSRSGGQIGIGIDICEVQRLFKPIFNMETAFATDGSQFDRLFEDGDRFAIGNLEVRVMHTPGHTPACVTYVVGDAAFVGDTLFMPDAGTARADFPGGDAATLYRSIRRILSLPPGTRVFVCHDYAPGGRPVAWQSNVAEQSAHNIHVGGGATEADFVRMRTERDASLSMPGLIIPSIQVNIRAGELPPAEDNGTRYLKVPLNAL